MNEAIQQLKHLSAMALEIGQPMMHATPEEVQRQILPVVNELVTEIVDRVEAALPNMAAGQQVYVATLISVMLAHGFTSEYVELSVKAMDNPIDALLRELADDAEGEDNEE